MEKDKHFRSMTIVFFTKYSRKGASSRVRSLQYIPLYEQKGYICKVKNLFNNEYLSRLYSKRSVTFLILKAYIKRILQLLFIRRSNIIIIEKELFPYLPSLAEWLLFKLGFKYYVDYDDAIFHNYDKSKSTLIRFFLKNKIDRVMKFSFYVIAGNKYLAERAYKAKANKIIVIPTVVDTEKYILKAYCSELKNAIVIGWIGTPITSKYLKPLVPVFKELAKNYQIKLRLIGTKTGIGIKGIEEIVEWSEVKEVALINSFDIGIMPLDDVEWEKGKCGYKLIQYMACGLPVIASPVGVNSELITEDENGFLATCHTEWKEKLIKLISSSDLRQNMGRKGRKLVEEKYSLSIQFNNWLHIIKQ
jgi:glycosyltransferase involved in cell wall biosynthesis